MPASAGWLGLPGLLIRAARSTPLVVSFPKAGRTWLRVMLDELGVHAEYTHFGAGVARALPASALTPRRWWCTRRPTLLLLRDPRDTLVSSFHQATKRRGRYAGSLPDFVRDARFGIEKVLRWNLMWCDLALSLETIAIVSYEELRSGGPLLLGHVARHFGAAPSAEALQRAWDHAHFDAMRARERRGGVEPRYRKILEPGDPNDPSSYKVRRGVVGGYRDELGATDVAFCDAALERCAYAARVAEALSARSVRGPQPAT